MKSSTEAKCASFQHQRLCFSCFYALCKKYLYYSLTGPSGQLFFWETIFFLFFPMKSRQCLVSSTVLLQNSGCCSQQEGDSISNGLGKKLLRRWHSIHKLQKLSQLTNRSIVFATFPSEIHYASTELALLQCLQMVSKM